MGFDGHFVQQQFQEADVRFGSKADISSVWTRHVLVRSSAADAINQRGLLPLHRPKGGPLRLLQEAQDLSVRRLLHV
jgi:hypothetical protein